MKLRRAVWGIEIGECALKALRCKRDEQSQRLVATECAYREYGQDLSRPNTDPVKSIRDAVRWFWQRYRPHGDYVTISVPGQSGYVRFHSLPTMTRKRLAGLPRSHLAQAVPRAPDEFVYDWQLMPGILEKDGFLMEPEVVFAALGRDTLFEAIRPFRDEGMNVRTVQLSPLALYNFIASVVLDDGWKTAVYDENSQPASVVGLRISAETTDVVITNGFRAWCRNFPLGGSHFTRRLAEDQGLSFADAERLKRDLENRGDHSLNETLDPVMNDLLTEVQRSVGFFRNIERRATVAALLLAGNGGRVPGLERHLANGLEIEAIDLASPRWADRFLIEFATPKSECKQYLSEFAVCWGLCLQGLGLAPLQTNLLPAEGIGSFLTATTRRLYKWLSGTG